MPNKVVGRLKVADMTSKKKSKRARQMFLRLDFIRLVSPLRLRCRSTERKTKREWIIFKTSTFGRALDCPVEPEPSAPFWARSLCHLLSCGVDAGVNSKTLVDVFFVVFIGGWDTRCNVRVLFVSSLFLLFLSFCTFTPFFLFCMFYLRSLYDIWLFTVKRWWCAHRPVSPPGGKREQRLCILSSACGWGRI